MASLEVQDLYASQIDESETRLPSPIPFKCMLSLEWPEDIEGEMEKLKQTETSENANQTKDIEKLIRKCTDPSAIITPRPEVCRIGKITGLEQYEKLGPGKKNVTLAQFSILNRPDMDVTAQIELLAHWYDEKTKRQHSSRSVAVFNNTNLTGGIAVEKFSALTVDERQHFERCFGINSNEEDWKRLLDDDKLHIVTIGYNGVKVGINLFNDRSQGSQSAIIQALHDALQEPTQISILVSKETIEDHVCEFNKSLAALNKHDPIRNHFPLDTKKPTPNVVLNKGQYPDDDRRPKYIVNNPPTYYKYWSQYNVLQGIACTQEYEHDAQTVHSYQLDGYLLPVPGMQADPDDGTPTKRMLAIVNLETNENDYRPYPGDRISVGFEGMDDTERWSGRVADAFPPATIHQIPIYITRPRDPNDKTKFMVHDPEIAPQKTVAELKDDVTTANFLRSGTTVPLTIKPAVSESNYARQCDAMRVIGEEANKGIPYYRTLRTQLLASNFDDLDVNNILEDLPNEMIDGLEEGLNLEQIEIIDALMELRGNFLVVNGPAGAGKTRVALKIVACLAFEKKKCLLTSPMNTITDRLYQKALREVNDLIKQQKVGPDRNIIIVRYYSQHSERDVLLNEANKNRPSTSRDLSLNLNELEQLQDIRIAADITQHHGNSFYQKFPGIKDKRVQVFEGSAGYLSGCLAGIIKPDGRMVPWANPQNHKEFIASYDEYWRGTPFSPDENRQFTESITKLRKELFNLASIVCTTLANSDNFPLRDSFKPFITIVDEASKATEVDTLTPLAHFQSKAVVLLGDPRQLPPVVNSSLKSNNLVNLLRQSLHARLLFAGADVVNLNVQFRYSPEIMDLISKTFYKGTLVAGPMDNTAIANARMIHKDIFNIEGNVVVADISKSRGLSSRANPSSYNTVEACVVAHIVGRYLDRGVASKDIGIVTPYEAQFNLIGKVIKELGKQRKDDLSDIMVAKFDGMIGDERPYLIMSLVVTKKLGFLVDARRLNQGLSRAIRGLVIVTNKRSLRNNVKNWAHTTLCRVLDHAHENVWKVPDNVAEIPPYLKNVVPLHSH